GSSVSVFCCYSVIQINTARANFIRASVDVRSSAQLIPATAQRESDLIFRNTNYAWPILSGVGYLQGNISISTYSNAGSNISSPLPVSITRLVASRIIVLG